MININIKLDPHAKKPTKATDGSGAFDIYAYRTTFLKPGWVDFVHTGVYLEIPKGYAGLLLERSSTHSKMKMSLANKVGLIDSDYRGELMMPYEPREDACHMGVTVQKWDRIGQLLIIPVPDVEFTRVEELNETERGEGGFGSTGS